MDVVSLEYLENVVMTILLIDIKNNATALDM